MQLPTKCFQYVTSLQDADQYVKNYFEKMFCIIKITFSRGKNIPRIIIFPKGLDFIVDEWKGKKRLLGTWQPGKIFG
jgi:hypothetical protein